MTAVEERAAVDAAAAPVPAVGAAPVVAAPVAAPTGGVRGTLTWVLTAVALLSLWSVFFGVVLSGFQEKHAQAQAYARLRASLALQTAPVGGQVQTGEGSTGAAPKPIVPGTPVALLNAPALGLRDVVVTEGTAAGDLKSGPGHRRDTVLPGELGTSVVYGRSTLFGAPFQRLRSAKPGDTIRVADGVGETTYVVDRVRRAGDPAPAPDAPGAHLTLVTATGGTFANGYQPQGALYVDATLKGQGLVAPAGRPSAVPADEDVLQGSPGGLFALVLWLQLLVLAGGGITWLASRWGAWQTYLVGVPVLVAALWGATQSAVELLPNVM